jgi:hypothetical protein
VYYPTARPGDGRAGRRGSLGRDTRCTLGNTPFGLVIPTVTGLARKLRLVWKAGLEPAAPCSQGRCATKLRHFQVVGCEARAGFASRASLAHSQPQETVAASVHACLATLVGPAGIEPALFRLGGGCSSVELRTQVRAGMATSCDRTGFTSLADARAVRRTQASSRCSGLQWPYPATGQDSHCSPSRARVNGLKRVLPAPCLPLPRAVGRRVPASLAGIALTLPDFIL